MTFVVALFALAVAAGCSSSAPAPRTATKSIKALVVYRNGYRLPTCTLGIAPAPCQRIVSPVELQFATPTAVDTPGQGGYDVALSDGSITVTAYVDQTPIGNCPSTGGAACLSDAHNLQDDAGVWDIKY